MARRRGSGAFVAYELHVTNLATDTMTLRRVEVLDADKGAVLASLSDSALLEGAEVSVTRAAVASSPPVRGEWAALNGPSNVSGHRRLVLESYYAYGTELLAVADGIVAATKDSIPQNVPGKRPKVDMVTVGGNFVGIDIGGGKFALYAHAPPGSLRVKVGDHVKRGQVIALLGNSGNSTEPHVHFQIADGPAFLTSEGVPYATDFDAVGNCAVGGNPPAIKCSRHAPTAVKGGIPLQNEIVRFPR